jgi:tRNA dimethylallyltransferase
MQIAKQFQGEIICADSRTVYRGMDIGTAKPSVEDQAAIPHHLIDITTPDKPTTVVDFKRLADQAITNILVRQKLPILVGGTGLYIDAVIYDFQFRQASDPETRRELSAMSVETLQHMLKEQGINLPVNSRNPRHLIRALETGGEDAKRRPLRPNTLVFGLSVDKPVLEASIRARTETMFGSGLEDEVKQLVATYGWIPPLQTIGYQEFKPYFSGSQNLSETQELIIHNTLAYAKRQKTWFKRNNSIHWASKQIEIVELITTHLNK